MDQAIDIQALYAAFRRRLLVIVAPVVLLMPLVVGIAFILPPSYTATARILVESQQIPSELAQSTVAVGVEERIALIRQRLTTRDNLLAMAERFNITRDRPDFSPTETIALMRSATDIDGVRLTGRRGGVTGVDISYTSRSAGLSAAVANDFLQQLLEQNIRQRTSRAAETSDYFRQESERLSRELTTLEEEITQFKIANEQALPESLDFRRQELANLQQRVFERELQQRDLLDQKDEIVTALREGRLTNLGREPTPEERELTRLQQELVLRRSTYTESHPIVRSLVNRVATLEQRVEAQLASLNANQETQAASTLSQRVNDMLGSLDQQIERLETRRTEEVARMAALEASIEATPAVALELGRLSRELDALRTQYQQNILKLARAETGERLEVSQRAERFEVIERAVSPPRPTSPNRPLIVMAGFAGSLAVGMGLAVLLELLNRSLRTPKDIETQLDMAPLVSIPYIRTRREDLWRTWLRRSAVVGVIVIVPLTLFVIDQFHQPLELLAQRLGERLGLDALQALVRARFGS